MTAVASPPVPLVLIHGMSAGPQAWDPVLALLAATRPVHVVTLAGHRGGAAIGDPAELTSSLYVDVLEAELDRLGIERADLVGNSLGGWVALQLAGRGRARSVVCLAPAGGWRAGGAFDRFLTAQFAIAFRTAERLATMSPQRLLRLALLRRVLLYPMVARPEKISDAAYLMTVRNLVDCPALPHSVHRPAARDVSATPMAPCPVLIAWSERDRILVSRASRRRLERQVGDAEVITLPGVGHVPMSDAPGLVARTILGFTGRALP